jgi:hypothetical protein
VPDSGGWLFVALFLLAHAAVWTPKKEELPTTRFVPAWYVDGAILVPGILITFVIGSRLLGRRP